MQAVDMSTLLERLNTAAAVVTDTKVHESERAWCKAAGLSPTYLGSARVRLQKGKGSGRTESLVKLAEASKGAIDPHWLLTGDGRPPTGTPVSGQSRETVEEDRYPNRAVVLAMAKATPGISDAAIRGLETVRLKAERDPTIEEWWTTLRYLQGVSEGDTAGLERPDVFD